MPAYVPLESSIKDQLNKDEQKVPADFGEILPFGADFFIFPKAPPMCARGRNTDHLEPEKSGFKQPFFGSN